MPSLRGLTGRRLRPALLCAGLVAAAAGGTGCSGITLAPGDGAWTVTGEGEAAEAVWTSGDVDVIVPLHCPADAQTVSAQVRNRGSAAAQLTFAAQPGLAALIAVGSVSGGPTTFDRTWTAAVLPGQPIDLPGGTPGAPGTLQFALRPDARWSAGSAPVVGSTITFDIDLTAPASRNASCPVRFRVTESTAGGWSGMSTPRQWVVVLLLSLAVAGVWIWAGG